MNSVSFLIVTNVMMCMPLCTSSSIQFEANLEGCSCKKIKPVRSLNEITALRKLSKQLEPHAGAAIGTSPEASWRTSRRRCRGQPAALVNETSRDVSLERCKIVQLPSNLLKLYVYISLKGWPPFKRREEAPGCGWVGLKALSFHR